MELDGLFELEGDSEVLALAEELGDIEADVLVLGEREADGESEPLGDTELLLEADGDVELLGEVELLGDSELEGERLAEGLSEADGETIAPTRAMTDEPAVIGFQRQTKRIRPEVIVAVATVIVISRVITRTGKLVVVLAMKTAWGLVPVQISSVFSCDAVVAATKQPLESEPPPAWASRWTPTASVPLELVRSFSTIA